MKLRIYPKILFHLFKISYRNISHFRLIYLIFCCRCRKSVDFSLKCAWLLDAYSSDASVPSKKKPHGIKLKNLILSDELRPRDQKMMTTSLYTTISLTVPTTTTTPSKKTHQRSQSDASALMTKTSSAGKLCLGDLSSGRAFDSGCVCFDSCQGVVNDLRGKKTECTCSVSFDKEKEKVAFWSIKYKSICARMRVLLIVIGFSCYTLLKHGFSC